MFNSIISDTSAAIKLIAALYEAGCRTTIHIGQVNKKI